MAPTNWLNRSPLSCPRCLACTTTCCDCSQRHGQNRQQPRGSCACGYGITGANLVELRTDRRRRRGSQMFNYCSCFYVPAAKDGLAPKNPVVKPPPPPPEEADLVKKEVSMEGSVTTTVSRAASLERFECESWSSSSILDGDEEGAVQSYFDLPMEMIKSSGQSTTHAPVTAAFVFESDRKAALKKLSAVAASDRHVKLWTSPGSCSPSPSSASISPTMQKAIEEFHAFLEARSA